MPRADDILIKVRVDSTQAQGELNRLLAGVQKAEARARTATRTPAAIQAQIDAKNVLAQLDLRDKNNRGMAGSIKAARVEVKGLEAELRDLNRQFAVLGPKGQVFKSIAAGIAPSATELKNFLTTARSLAGQGLLQAAFPGGAAGMTTFLQGIMQQTLRGAARQNILTSRDTITQAQQLIRARTGLQARLGSEQLLGGLGSPGTIRSLIAVNQQLRDLSRTVPQLRFAGAAAQVKQFTAQLKNAEIAASGAQRITLPVLEQLARQQQTLRSSEQARIVSGQTPTRGNIAAQIVNVNRQLDVLGRNNPAPRVRELTGELDRLTKVQERYAANWDTATRTFGHHALRIAEGLVIYNAFTRALEGISQAFGFVAKLDQDTTRLEQVIGSVSQTQMDDFLQSVGDTAVSTATDLRELTSVTDLVAGAFRTFRTDSQGNVDTEALLGDIEGFDQIIGEFSNVVAPGGNIEGLANQLVSLFRITQEGLESMPELADMQPLDRFRAFLDGVVVTGQRSSLYIEQIADGLLEAGLNANVAGFDLRLLSAIMYQLTIRTGQSGREIGTLLRTSLSKLSDPDVLQGFQDIVDGVINIRDATGELKEADTILVEFFQAVQSGALTSEQQRQALQELVPPINPGAVGFNNALVESMGAALLQLAQDSGVGSGALERLSLIIANTLPGRFQAFQSRIQTLLLGFNEEIKETSRNLLDFGNGFLAVIEAVDPAITVTIAKAALFVGGASILIAVFQRFGAALLGIKGGFAAFAAEVAASGVGLRLFTVQANLSQAAMDRMTISTAASQAGMTGLAARSGAAAVGLQAAAGAAAVARGALTGLMAVASRLLPLLIIFAGLEIIGTAADQASKITALREEAELLEAQAQAIIHISDVIETQQERGGFAPSDFNNPNQALGFQQMVSGLSGLGINITGEETSVQLENLRALGAASADLSSANQLTAESFQVMLDAIVEADGSIKDTKVDQDDLFAAAINASTGLDGEALSVEQLLAQMGLLGDETQQLTAAQQLAAESSALMESLLDEQAKTLLDLNDRLKEGVITQDQWNLGQQQTQQAAQAAADLVAALGDQLRTLIPELGGAQAGNEALAGAVYELFIASGNALPLISANVGIISQLSAVNQVAAVTTLNLANSMEFLTIKTLAARFGLAGVFETLVNSVNLNVKVSSSSTGITQEMQRALEQILNAIRSAGNSVLGTGLPSFSTTTPVVKAQAGVLDIGDLSPSQVQQLIALATALRNAIPGETAASKDDLVAIIKDAVLLQNVKGIDERLLRIALEELTQQMQDANDLAKQQLQQEALLSNLVVQSGPLSALVSQPTLFGVGGSLASGNGLNFDPTQGNFIINVPVELNGLEPAALQQLIYDIISKAIRDALRL